MRENAEKLKILKILKTLQNKNPVCFEVESFRKKFENTLYSMLEENGVFVMREVLYRFLMVQMMATSLIEPPPSEPPGKLVAECRKIIGELFEDFVIIYSDRHGSVTEANSLVKKWILDFYRKNIENLS